MKTLTNLLTARPRYELPRLDRFGTLPAVAADRSGAGVCGYRSSALRAFLRANLGTDGLFGVGLRSQVSGNAA